ncbi:hypothetical protein DY000_02000102 [Brassica cretica]|uniref:Mediator of RNA polymerase II transcription subunit 4 n=1 Tax=Brassica cretica TaxID=69181 RepID=A0ABQ7CHV9_BRACR|nr:hypothetical protein DY000_02000102 [Brassica cretica]
MLQHQIALSPARLGLTGPGSPSVQTLTPSRHGHPTASSATIASSALLSLLPPLPRAQALLQQMSILTSKLFDVSPNRSLWLSPFLNSLLTHLFEAVTEVQEILNFQDAKQKVAREVKSKDSSLLAFANKLKEAERVLDIDDYSDYRKPKRSKTEDSSSSVTTTVSSQLTLKDILAYAHKISYTTFALPEFGAGQAPLRGALPPAPQDEQMRASQLSTTPSLISTSVYRKR